MCRLKSHSSLLAVVLQVTIGNSKQEYLIGYLQYETESGKLPLWGIIAIAVAAGVLLLIVFIILIAYRHQSSKSERVLKNMQEQMDVLELRVAAECKEGELSLILFVFTVKSTCSFAFSKRLSIIFFLLIAS